MTLEELEAQYHEHIKDLDVSYSQKRFYTTRTDHGIPHVEKKGRNYYLISTDRGVTVEKKRTTDLEEILYWLLKGVTMDLALTYEMKRRKKGVDGRRVWFPYQEQLLYDMKPEWGMRLATEHYHILQRNPYDDSLH